MSVTLGINYDDIVLFSIDKCENNRDEHNTIISEIKYYDIMNARILVAYHGNSNFIEKMDSELVNKNIRNNDNLRTHSDLIEIVEKLGDEANGRLCKLKIIKIPDINNWYIHEYDGKETVREGRVWG